MTTESCYRTNILIVGAGPVGLTTAIILAYYGIEFTIIDKGELIVDKSKAMTITPRTLEQLNIIGVADSLVSGGIPAYIMNYYYKRFFLGSTNFKHLKSKFNFILQVPQSVTVEVLQQKLSELGVKINKGNEFIAMNKLSDNIEIQVFNKNTQKKENYLTNYLIACDGGRSLIRTQDGILFHGDSSVDSFIMADVAMSGFPYAFNERHIFYLPKESFLAVLPISQQVEANTYRIITTIKAGENCDESQVINKLKQKMESLKLNKITFSNPQWISRFNPKQFVVNNFCSDRILYAGDAAHIQSPIGSQGLNTGIQDAFNLGWKLSFVSQKLSTSNFLLNYHEERYPIALNLFNYNNAISKIVFEKSIFYRKKVLAMKLLNRLSYYNKRDILNISQLNINYNKNLDHKSDKHLTSLLIKGHRLPEFRTLHNNYLYDLLKINQITCFFFLNDLFSPKFLDELTLINRNIFNLIVIGSSDNVQKFNDLYTYIYDKDNQYFEEFKLLKPIILIVRPDAYIYEVFEFKEDFSTILNSIESGFRLFAS